MASGKDLSDRSALWYALRELTHQEGIQREDLLEVLAGEARELQRCWEVDLKSMENLGRAQALDLVRKRVSDRLTKHIERLEPPPDVERKKYINAVTVSFNLETDSTPTNHRRRNLEARRKWLADEARGDLQASSSRAQFYRNNAISQIEQQILASGYEPSPGPAVDGSPASSGAIAIPAVPVDQIPHGAVLVAKQPALVRQALAADQLAPSSLSALLPGYIRRAQHEERFVRHLEEGTKFFLLYGDAGTGKTTLARHFGTALTAATAKAARKPGDPVSAAPPTLAEISAQSPERLKRDVMLLLRRDGIDPKYPDWAIPTFKEHLASAQAPPVVVFDNMESWDELKDFIPPLADLRSVVILTARQRPMVLERVAVFLPIADMEPAEAAAMVRSQLPTVSEDDASGLAYDLGYRPLAISQACGFIVHEGTSVPVFRRVLGEKVTRVLDIVVLNGEPTLTAIYRLTIESLDADALKLLDLIVLSYDSLYTSKTYLQSAWSGVGLLAPFPSRTSVEDFEFWSALRDLESRCLIEAPEITRVQMHPLTARLFGELRATAIDARGRELLEALNAAPLLDNWQAGKIFSLWMADQAGAIAGLLRNLNYLAEDSRYFPALAKLAAFVIRGGTQDHSMESVLGSRLDIGLDFLQRHAAADHGDDLDFANLEIDHFLAEYANKVGVDAYGALGSPDVSPVPCLCTGAERHPLAEQVVWAPGSTTDQRSEHLFSIRKLAIEAHYNRWAYEAAQSQHALGQLYFDVGNYKLARDMLERAWFMWWDLSPVKHAGELCKTGALVADCHHRLGDYDEAETSRNIIIDWVKSVLERDHINFWTADAGANYSLYKMLCGYPLRFPELVDSRGEPVTPDAPYLRIFGKDGGLMHHLRDQRISKGSIYLPMQMHTSALRRAAWQPKKALGNLRYAEQVSAAHQQWPLSKLKYLLTSAKIHMYLDETTGTSYSTAETLEQILAAAETAEQLHMLYWKADALLTAYVLCVRFGCGTETDGYRLFPRLQVASSQAKQRHRLEVAETARDSEQPFTALWLLGE
jgi:tetratricopeptide (TPR) repeat protein